MTNPYEEWMARPVVPTDFEGWSTSLGHMRKALLPTGSVLSVGQAALQLGLSEADVDERIADRSILAVEILDLYDSSFMIPAFQFEGAYHIPGFHDVWDRLDPGCTVERICQFFSHETFSNHPTLGDSSTCIAHVLRRDPNDEVMACILEQAEHFKQWCSLNAHDIAATRPFLSEAGLEGDLDLAMEHDPNVVIAAPGLISRPGLCSVFSAPVISLFSSLRSKRKW